MDGAARRLSSLAATRGVRVLQWNPHSITAPYRAEEVSQQFAGVPFVLLAGTQRRAWDQVSHSVQRLPAHTAIHFGWRSKQRNSNKSAGCSIFIQHRVKDKHITQITAPPPSMAGRGGAVTVQQGVLQVRLIVAYSPPVDHQRLLEWTRKVREVMEWIEQQVAATLHRVTPVVGLDLNSDLGLDQQGLPRPDEHVGDFFLGRQNYAGEQCRRWMEREHMKAVDTFGPSGWTYQGSRGHRSRIDFIVVPMGLPVLGCTTWDEQSAPVRTSPHFADHIPVTMVADMPSPATQRTSAMATWDREALSRCLQNGDRRPEFVAQVDKELERFEGTIHILTSTPYADEAYHLFTRLVRRIAAGHFGRVRGVGVRAEIREGMRAKQELLEERAQLRARHCLDDPPLQELAERIRCLDRHLRKLRNREIDEKNRQIEDDLAEAHRARNVAGVHRLARLRAGRGVGVHKVADRAPRSGFSITARREMKGDYW